MDTTERIHLLDVKNDEEIEVYGVDNVIMRVMNNNNSCDEQQSKY